MPPPPRRRRRNDRGRERPSPLAPVTAPRRLDLDLPVEQPLGPAEVEEMKEHLNFLRRFKGAMRLSLNAAEDLLVNGVKPPDDRGVCKHLLAKVDRAAVHSAITREPIRSDAAMRARFLAGVVRIQPDAERLLEYLDALAHQPDRRDAARAFSATVDRIDFAALSRSNLAKLLEVVRATFREHDRTQALFGLLDSESFQRALAAATDLAPELVTEFAPLAAAHAVAFRGRPPPADDEDRARLDEGLRRLLDAPFAVLASYPEPVRARLVELAIADQLTEGDTAREATRKLIETLPRSGEQYTGLLVARADQLLRTHELPAAKKLLARIVRAEPEHAWAKRRLEATDWAEVGEVLVSTSDQGALKRGYWLDGSAFVRVRTAAPAAVGVFMAQVKLQSELCLPGVLPVLAHGLGRDGTAFAVVPRVGRPFASAGLGLADALYLALEGAKLAAGLARAGLEIDRLAPEELVLVGKGPPSLALAALGGARASNASAAQIHNAAAAAAFARTALAGVMGELPRATRSALANRQPLQLLVDRLARAYARES